MTKTVFELRLEPLEGRRMLDATAQLVGDLNTTPSEWSRQHAWLGEEMYFAADDGSGDVELWKTDGTEAGTVRVKDIRPGPHGSSPMSLVATNSRVFFTAVDELHGRELWVTDGTSRVTDLQAGEAHAFQRYDTFTPLGDQLFFEFDREPWASDGTPEGTRILKDIRPGGEGSHPSFGDTFNGKIYFTASLGDSHRTLWESDGT